MVSPKSRPHPYSSGITSHNRGLRIIGGMRGVPHAAEFERAMIRSGVKAGMARARRYGTKSGKPIGQQPPPRHKIEEIRAELTRGTGILKTARLCGTGVSVAFSRGKPHRRRVLSSARASL